MRPCPPSVLVPSSVVFLRLLASNMVPYKWWIYLRTLAALLLVYLRALAYRLSGKQKFAPPRPGDATLNVDWLRFVLEANGYTRFSIKTLSIGDLNDNRGLAGQINKIRVEYDPARTVEPHPPTRFVLKMTRSGFSGRSFVIAAGSDREATFYASARFRNLAAHIPHVYYTYGSALLGEAVILLEDITTKPATPLNFVFGNQIWGAPEVKPPRDPVASLETVFVAAAKQHAAFWNEKSLLAEPWLRSADWFHNRGRKAWEATVQRVRSDWANAKRKAADPKNGWKFSDKLIQIIDQSLAHTSWEALQAHIKTMNFTLTHGDFHASNMFLLRDESSEVDRPVMFDWSEVGPWEPTTDLGQMLISDVKPAIFNAHSKALLRKYWQTLLEHGVSEKEYPWDVCWNSFCRGSAERWIFLFCVLTSFPLGAPAIQYFHDQLLSFIATHCPTQPYFELKTLLTIL